LLEAEEGGNEYQYEEHYAQVQVALAVGGGVEFVGDEAHDPSGLQEESEPVRPLFPEQVLPGVAVDVRQGVGTPFLAVALEDLRHVGEAKSFLEINTLFCEA